MSMWSNVRRKLNQRNVQRGITLFGVFTINLATGATAFYGNLLTYTDSYLKYRTGEEPGNDGGTIMAVFCIFWSFALTAYKRTFRCLGDRTLYLLAVIVYDLSILSSQWAIQHSVGASIFTLGIWAGLGSGAAEAMAFSYFAAWAPETNVGFVTAIATTTSVGPIFTNIILTRYANPNNLPTNGSTENREYFDQAEILDRVPSVFTLLFVMFVTAHTIGLCLIRNNDEPQIIEYTLLEKQEEGGQEKEEECKMAATNGMKRDHVELDPAVEKRKELCLREEFNDFKSNFVPEKRNTKRVKLINVRPDNDKAMHKSEDTLRTFSSEKKEAYKVQKNASLNGGIGLAQTSKEYRESKKTDCKSSYYKESKGTECKSSDYRESKENENVVFDSEESSDDSDSEKQTTSFSKKNGGCYDNRGEQNPIKASRSQDSVKERKRKGKTDYGKNLKDNEIENPKQNGRNIELCTDSDDDIDNKTMLVPQKLSKIKEYGTRESNELQSFSKQSDGKTFSVLEILRRKDFWVLWFGTGCIHFSFLSLETFYKMFSQSRIKDDHFLGIVGPALQMFLFSGRIGWGALVDRFGVKKCIMGSSASVVITMSYIYFLPSVGKFAYLPWVCMTAFANAGMFGAYPVAVYRYFGNTHMSTVYGMTTTSMVLSGLIFPALTTAVLNRFNWWGVFCVSAILNAINFLMNTICLPED